VNAKKFLDPLPFAEGGQENSLPGEEKILRHLAQTLSVEKTLKRFPGLKTKELQDILLKSAARVAEKTTPLPSPSVGEGFAELFIYADGASRGNPGEAGIGAVITDARGRAVKELKCFLGMATNNVAEYQALILALKEAEKLGAASVHVYLDSELVVRQVRGEYRVREPHLQTLHQQAHQALKRFPKYSINSIAREENRRADQLANEAIDQKT